MLKNYERAYITDSPTIGQVANELGSDFVIHWIRQQLMALYGASSNKDQGIADGINFFANSFAMQVRGYKFTELMLFFARYKAGRYDNSYYSFDARRIGSAFFHEFIPQRNHELERITNKVNLEEIEKRRFTPPAGYSSLSWYNELKKRAAEGDAEAMKILHNKL